MFKSVTRLAATSLVAAGFVFSSAGTAMAYPPVEQDDRGCAVGEVMQVTSCRPSPVMELSGPFANWFGGLATKAGGNN